MSKFEKLLLKLLQGNADKSFDFEDIVSLLKKLGFELRIKGSHHIFYKDGIEEIVNLQSDSGKAKPYQVKQVRMLVLKYKLNAEYGS
jgi:hypothetical protein